MHPKHKAGINNSIQYSVHIFQNLKVLPQKLKLGCTSIWPTIVVHLFVFLRSDEKTASVDIVSTYCRWTLHCIIIKDLVRQHAGVNMHPGLSHWPTGRFTVIGTVEEYHAQILFRNYKFTEVVAVNRHLQHRAITPKLRDYMYIKMVTKWERRKTYLFQKMAPRTLWYSENFSAVWGKCFWEEYWSRYQIWSVCPVYAIVNNSVSISNKTISWVITGLKMHIYPMRNICISDVRVSSLSLNVSVTTCSYN